MALPMPPNSPTWPTKRPSTNTAAREGFALILIVASSGSAGMGPVAALSMATRTICVCPGWRTTAWVKSWYPFWRTEIMCSPGKSRTFFEALSSFSYRSVNMDYQTLPLPPVPIILRSHSGGSLLAVAFLASFRAASRSSGVEPIPNEKSVPPMI
jgi:hypothetical protein